MLIFAWSYSQMLRLLIILMRLSIALLYMPLYLTAVLSARETLAAERGAVQLQRANSDKERDRLISSIESVCNSIFD